MTLFVTFEMTRVKRRRRDWAWPERPLWHYGTNGFSVLGKMGLLGCLPFLPIRGADFLACWAAQRGIMAVLVCIVQFGAGLAGVLPLYSVNCVRSD